MEGLTTAEAQKRLKEVGLNLIKGKRQTPLIIQFLRQFKDLLVIILIVASIFAYAANEKVDAVIIIGIVFLNALIGFIQEYKAEKAIEALKKLLAPKARVLRDNTEMMIDAKELVPGDVIILAAGDKISADCELFEENEIGIDESVLTGESVPVRKNTDENKTIFMGTQITSGTGRAVVTKTGMHTEFGKIATLTSETQKDKSPLQKELANIGVFVGKITLAICAFLFLVGIFVQGRQLIDTLLFSISVAVAAVPEGLPATITVALALGVQRLARKNVIVKQLSSVETLGSTTVICSDKTGTLTKNEMTVKEIVIDNHDIMLSGTGYEPEGNLSIHNQTKDREYFDYEKKDLAQLAFDKPDFYHGIELAMKAAVLCNNAKLEQSKVDGKWHILGDPTEGAMITAAEKTGFTAAHITSKNKRIYEIPFDSDRKCMSVIAQEMDNQKVYGFTKGAPDVLIEKCTHILIGKHIVNLDETQKRQLLKRTETMASQALRTLAVAYKEVSKEIQRSYKKEEIEKGLVFLGLFGMMDPPREEVKEAVKLTHKAGIQVFIVTGDNGLTAHAIAKELGLVSSYGVNIITGEMLDKMSDDKLLRALAPGQQTIFARVSPAHKLRIVDTLKKTDAVVAVTGDGVNDAPALKRADIGIAMGITGTDVSKEAANMVLTDDSFGSIVTAIIEGRTIYENMKKFIFYIFSSNIGELVAIFSVIMVGLPAPLTAVFILIINTLTDVLPALALGVEPVERNIIEKPPRRPDAKIMQRAFIKRCTLNGVLIGLVTMGAFTWNLFDNGWRYGDKLVVGSPVYMESATMAFVVLTFMQMIQALNSRSETVSIFKMHFFSNKYLIGAITISVLSTIAIVQLPFFSKYIKTFPLSFGQWMALTAISLSILVWEEINKHFFLNKKSR